MGDVLLPFECGSSSGRPVYFAGCIASFSPFEGVQNVVCCVCEDLFVDPAHRAVFVDEAAHARCYLSFDLHGRQRPGRSCGRCRGMSGKAARHEGTLIPLGPSAVLVDYRPQLTCPAFGVQELRK